jgi:hypothetical protein
VTFSWKNMLGYPAVEARDALKMGYFKRLLMILKVIFSFNIHIIKNNKRKQN